MGTMIPFYKGIWQEAARRLAADFEELSPGIWRVSSNGRSTFISNFKVQIDDLVVLNMAGSKSLTYRLLMENNLPVPDHLTFEHHEIKRAWEFMERFPGQFFVVKPAAGTSGARGVTTRVRSRNDLVSACALASLYGRDILIERYISGEPYRLLILDGKLIHASRRRGLWLTGDGISSVRQLLPRGLSVGRRDFLVAELSAQGVTVKTVMQSGQKVYLGYFGDDVKKEPRNREVRTVFNEDATALIGPELAEEAVYAAKTLGSKFAGVDVITLDPSVSLLESGGVINEVNTTPGLHHHHNLFNGKGAFPAVSVLEYLLKVPSLK